MGGEPEKYLQFFDMICGFICETNLKTDTNEAQRLIDDEKLLIETHLAMKPVEDVTSPDVIHPEVEDGDYSEEEDPENNKKDDTRCFQRWIK